LSHFHDAVKEGRLKLTTNVATEEDSSNLEYYWRPVKDQLLAPGNTTMEINGSSERGTYVPANGGPGGTFKYDGAVALVLNAKTGDTIQVPPKDGSNINTVYYLDEQNSPYGVWGNKAKKEFDVVFYIDSNGIAQYGTYTNRQFVRSDGRVFDVDKDKGRIKFD